MSWPLPGLPARLPEGEAAFGALRKHDIHTGIDLHCPEGSLVAALQPGLVVAVLPFTGPDADSPWWNATQAVLVEDSTGVWLYGEVAPRVEVGARLGAGDPVGTVVRVLRHDKGKPTSMLHLERYRPGTREPVWWRLGDPQPEALLDPLEALLKEGG